nr:MAG TPA: hypothetical protein [Bacteriophage sp.]
MWHTRRIVLYLLNVHKQLYRYPTLFHTQLDSTKDSIER